jgi:hypothetical protein
MLIIIFILKKSVDKSTINFFREKKKQSYYKVIC